MNQKFCIDCRWYVQDSIPPQCDCPYIGDVSLVTGKRDTKFCAVQRRDWAQERTCGEQGKHWEARDSSSVESNGYA
jgi:hypothetical protein